MSQFLTSADRFAAAAFAHSLAYDGPDNLRVSIMTAGQVEGFADCYSGGQVRAASDLIRAAAVAGRSDVVASSDEDVRVETNLTIAHQVFVGVMAAA